jgi:3-methyladenine DNA glycosylase AlkD
MYSAAMTVDEILDYLRRRGSKRNVDGMARYGIVAPKVFGVSVGTLRDLGKKIGRDHALALALWKSGWYEARMLCAFVDEPDKVTPAQMDRWAKDFDNWAICDSTTFHLFDKTPHAWAKVRAWAPRKEEFVKRAAFALLAAMAVHDKKAPDAPFRRAFPLIARAAKDERNFVKKGVSWALRAIGNRSTALNREAIQLATRLAKSKDAAERWVGKDTLRDITRPMVQKRAAKWSSRRSS